MGKYFVGEIREKRKINDYTSKYVNSLEFLLINLLIVSILTFRIVFLSASNGSITIQLFISPIGALIGGFITSFITIFFYVK